MRAPYLAFVHVEVPGSKTACLRVESLSQRAILGYVKWFGRWRQYCFFPIGETVWSDGCLEEIQHRIRALMEARRMARAARRGR